MPKLIPTKIEIENNIEKLIGKNETRIKEKLALIYGVEAERIRAWLRKYNIKIKTPRTLISHPEVDKEWMIKNWVNTSKSMKELETEFNIRPGLLDERRILFKLEKSYKYKWNINKFKNIDDYHLWYIGGLLATDGYFKDNNDSIEFSLTGEDENKLLTNIKNYYEGTAPIFKYTHSYRLYISFKGIKEFTSNLFNLPLSNKTFEADVPQSFPNKECALSYIRGCIDGDGCIGFNKDKTKISISLMTSSEKFILGLIKIIKKYTNISFNFRYEKRKMFQNGRIEFYPVMDLSKQKDCIKFLDEIYSVEDCFRLQRKYEKYLEVKNV